MIKNCYTLVLSHLHATHLREQRRRTSNKLNATGQLAKLADQVTIFSRSWNINPHFASCTNGDDDIYCDWTRSTARRVNFKD